MADRDHPKTHVEDQDLDGPRKQPLSPRHEGIDPLTESDTMYPAERTGDPETATNEEPEEGRTLEDHLDPTNQPSPESPASPDNEPADVPEKDADEELADSTKPGQPDDTTPDAGEKAEDQEPHTDKGNTSPANRTKSSKK